MKTIAVILALALVGITPARGAYEGSAQQLLNRCESDEGLEFGLCMGVIAALSSMAASLCIDAQRYATGENAWVWDYIAHAYGADFAGGVTGGAMHQAILNYIRSHPERWSENDLSVALHAMQQNWPCTLPAE